MFFSIHAHAIRCLKCNSLNTPETWPLHGDQIAMYFKDKESAQNEPWAYKVRVKCQKCDTEWYVCWERDPS